VLLHSPVFIPDFDPGYKGNSWELGGRLRYKKAPVYGAFWTYLEVLELETGGDGGD
jgi:hypothetical protein